MNDERMNQVIHEQIMGRAYSYDEAFQRPTIPKYCTDLNAVALAEAKVIDGDLNKSISLVTCIASLLSGREMTTFAPAHQRAEALLKHEGLWEADDER